MFRLKTLICVIALSGPCVLVGDPTAQAQAQEATLERGPVTNLPLPRFVSMKAANGNVRRGPSLGHKIDWIFKRRNMPLEIIAEYGNWRRVRDKDGAGGWVHYSLLSGVRTVIIEQDLLPLRAKPEIDAQVRAYAEAGVIARLGPCENTWCQITSDGYKGWVQKPALWGVTGDDLGD